MNESFDLIVVGAGQAGETVASRLAGDGMRIALVERELIGGECAYWACIPSKTLLRAAEIRREAPRVAGTSEPPQRFDQVAAYRDYMVRDHDDGDQISSYEKRGVRVFKGEASFTGRGRLRVGDDTLEAAKVVIATGSEPVIPAIPGLEQAGYWTNREATSLKQPPASVCVLGGGPVGIELAQMLRRFGARVDLVEEQDRLLAREDRRASELVLEALREDGITVHLDAQVSTIEREDGERVVHIGDRTVRAAELLVATSRKPRTDGLGLERVGIEPGSKGIEIDERCRAADGVWAIGDVTGVMPFSHVAKYQGRIACADISGAPARADYRAIPRVVFTDPEIAAVGLTEAQASEQGLDLTSARIALRDSISRPYTYETDPRGELGVLVDKGADVLVGAWAVAPLAGEWIHYAALAIKAKIPVEVLRDTVAQFPTYSEAYLNALDQLR
jgi:dihydrolipoamide dehydrogenase